MNPIFYDFKKAIKSRGMLAVVIFMVLFSLAVIPLISSAMVSPQSGVVVNAMSYSASDGYHVLLLARNGLGQLLSNVQLNLTTPSREFAKIVSTNESGFVEITVPVNSSVPNQLLVSFPGSSQLPSQPPIFLQPTKDGQTQPQIDFVTDQKNATKTDLFIFATGPYFQQPDYKLYYAFSASGSVGADTNASQMKLLANITSLVTILSINVPSNATNDFVILSLFDNNGSFLLSSSASAGVFEGQSFQLSPTQLASSFISGVLAIFVPLMAVLAGYSIYGRERVTGILESVLVRPVTRRSLLTTRFIAGVLASAVAILATILVVDAILLVKLNQSLSASFIFTSWASMVVEATAFLGFIFIVSQLTKSTGALIGSGIALFLVLDFLWSLILFLAFTAVGSTFGSALSLRIQMLLDFFNPSQYLSLVQVYQLHSISGLPVNPSDYGVTLVSLVIDGLLWLVLPLILAIWLVNRRD